LGDFLEHRYSRAVRGVVGALLWVVTLFILAGQLIGISAVLTEVGLSRAAGIGAGATVILIYYAAGGLLSSAWVNLTQLVVLMTGFLIATPLAIQAAGGLDVFSQHTLPPGFTAIWGGRDSVGWLLLLGPAFIVSPGLIQKAYGAIDERAIRIGVGATGLALLGFGFLPPLIGMAARVLHPDLPSVNLALTSVLARDLPPAIGTLALAAVFSAELSSADAVLFMLSTSASQDLYRRFIRPEADERDVLRTARIAAIVGSVVAVGLALVIPTVVGALKVFYSLLTVVLFVPVVAALHSRRAGQLEALLSIAGGVGVMVTLALLTGGRDPAAPAAGGLLAAAVSFGLVAAVRFSTRD
jgi:SSS family solute:Na+ symporter